MVGDLHLLTLALKAARAPPVQQLEKAAQHEERSETSCRRGSRLDPRWIVQREQCVAPTLRHEPRPASRRPSATSCALRAADSLSPASDRSIATWERQRRVPVEQGQQRLFSSTWELRQKPSEGASRRLPEIGRAHV